MKLFFCYERAFNSAWSPVCYHGDIPKKTSRDMEPERSAVWTVPDDLIDGDTPNFGKLTKRFPAPEVPA